MKYSSVDERSDNSSLGRQKQQERSDEASIASSISRAKSKFRHKRVSSDLSEPLTAATTELDEEIGGVSSDPFFVFRSDLIKKLELVDDCLADYLRVVHDTDTSVNCHEFRDTKKQLKRHIKNAESTLKDVQTTVQLVENDRDKFAHIGDTQLYERKSLVNTSKERLSRAKEEMNSDSVKLKLVSDERNKAVRRSGDGLLGATNDRERENTNFIMDNQAQTSLLMQHQDETLDELGEAVTRVGDMAVNINEEINQQNKMLDELDDDMADAEEQLGLVMGKLAKFLQTKNKCQLGTILGLSLTVVVLLMLLIYS